jgi:type III pantothenate kinase
MLLTLDIGNTTTTIGLFRGSELLLEGRFGSSSLADEDEAHGLIAGLIEKAGPGHEKITAAIVASVVPRLEEKTRKALGPIVGKGVYFLGQDISAPMNILTENPAEVGADRLANAVAAYHMQRRAVIIVDIGTAITVDLVTEAGEFAGGAIAPGPGTAAQALFERTAQLPRVDIERPASVLGRSTTSALKSGLYFGFCGLIDGLIRGIEREAGAAGATVIATGGLAGVFAPGCKGIKLVDEFLTLKGLNIIYNEVLLR